MEIPGFAQNVRRHDRDRYLTTLFAPEGVRKAMWAVLAFNLEIARILETVSDPMLGLIRLQWWRDALEEMQQGKPRRHEVIQPLQEVITKHQLPFAPLFDILTAREQDVEDTPPATMEALEEYVENTSGRIIDIYLKLLNINDKITLEAGRHLGLAYGLTGVIRAFPHMLQHGRVTIPASIITPAKLTADAIRQNLPGPYIAPLLRLIGEVARQHLVHLDALLPRISPEAQAPFLLRPLIARRLQQLERCEYDVFSLKRDLSLPDSLRMWLENRKTPV